MSLLLEICAGSIGSALAAQQGGADRVELCDNLYDGGTTPSYGMLKVCKELLNIPVFPILRPRGGDFVYSEEEFEIMKHDLICCRDLGCEGVVLGILKRDGSIDIRRCKELVSLAGTMELTFHRAFDRCSDFSRSLEEIIDMGFHRLLTSGGQAYAEDGIKLLRSLVNQAGERLRIMPGSGVTEYNLSKIAKETGAAEFHSTARIKAGFAGQLEQDNMEPRFSNETNPGKVAKMRLILDSVTGL